MIIDIIEKYVDDIYSKMASAVTEIKRKIVLGSTSTLKQKCVLAIFPEFDIICVDVASGVSEQPIGIEETREGARNRCISGLTYCPDAKLSFGIENGIINCMTDMACVICQVISIEKMFLIEKWSDGLDIPDEWAELIVNYRETGKTNKTYAKLAKETFHISMDDSDPHSYLTAGLKSREKYLTDTLYKIRQQLEAYHVL